ncbi:MAG TPA: hypothetical protein VFN35_28660 [Ktedonobacteraceae bacterium]|nr:hypothetical protein [Ktedonobacteraceae bacterium]
MASNTTSSQSSDDDGYVVYPVLEGTDHREHTQEHPFCSDPTCPCHEDPENLETLQEWYDGGLIGSVDGRHIYHGRTI